LGVTARLVLENLTLGLVLVCISVLVQAKLTLVVLRLFALVTAALGSRSSFSIRVLPPAILVLTIVVGHLVQINLWAVSFYLLAFFDDFWSAQAFVGETYTTLGYGDLLLPPERRMLAGWLALTGMIMIGWSTALLVYVLTKYHDAGVAVGRRPGDRLDGGDNPGLETDEEKRA
jgi:hypothetical protein